MNNELPRSLDDISYYKNGYEGKKIWTILGTNKRLSGSLNLSDEDVSLEFELQRDLVEELEGKRVNKITATRDDYSRVALIDSSVWESPFSRALKRGPGKMRLSPSLIVLQGSNKPVPDEITTLTGYLPGIGEWFKEDFLDFDHEKYKFKQTKTIYHEIPVGTTAKIILNGKLTINHESLIADKKFMAYPESFVRIEFPKPTKISSAISLFNHVQNFFNFIFSTPHATHIFTSSIQSKGKMKLPLFILSPQRVREYKREDKRRDNSMLFAWEDILDINDVFIQWIIEYERIHEIIDVIVLLKSTHVSEEIRFTTIINALEAVHRRYFDHKLQPDDDYNQRIDKILEQIDEDEDENLVKRRLEYGNEISLRTRLKEVYTMGEDYGIDKPAKSTTDKIIETRNYFTHGDDAKKENTLGYHDLSYINGLLGRYLKVILLQILGVSKAELKDIVTKSPQFQSYYRDEPPTRKNFIF